MVPQYKKVKYPASLQEITVDEREIILSLTVWIRWSWRSNVTWRYPANPHVASFPSSLRTHVRHSQVFHQFPVHYRCSVMIITLFHIILIQFLYLNLNKSYTKTISFCKPNRIIILNFTFKLILEWSWILSFNLKHLWSKKSQFCINLE